MQLGIASAIFAQDKERGRRVPQAISQRDFQEALQALFGSDVKGLSVPTISRCKWLWEQEHEKWNRRNTAKSRYVYFRADDARQCILVIVGITERGRKEFVAIEDGYRESEQRWTELLLRLRRHL